MKLTQLILEGISYKVPNFDYEWEEAVRYPEFKKLGKHDWIDLATKGREVTITSAKDINNTDANKPDSFKKLNKDKRERTLAQIKSGTVEMPIVAKYPDGYKELLGGNTRLTALMAKNGKATIWMFDVPEEILNEFSLPKFDVVKPIIDKFLGGVKKAGIKLLEIVKRESKQTLVLVKEVAEYVITGEKPNEAEQKKISKQLMDLGFLALLGISGNIPVSAFGILYWILQESGVAKEFLKLDENFKDGKVKGKSRPGRVKKAGASCKGSVSDLRAKAKKYGGEKGKMYHWCANMKGGKNK